MKPLLHASHGQIRAALYSALQEFSDEDLTDLGRLRGGRFYMDAGDIGNVVVSYGHPDDAAAHQHMKAAPASLGWAILGIELNQGEQADPPGRILENLEGCVLALNGETLNALKAQAEAFARD